MSNKVIDEKTLTNPEEFQRAQALITSIKSRHTIISQETEKIEQEKEEIGKISIGILKNDILNPAIPEFYQNHDYHCDGGIVHVNFRVGSSPVTDEKDKNAKVEEKLRPVLGEAYEKLFKEDVTFEPTASQAKLLDQAQDNPDAFTFGLKQGIAPDKLVGMVKMFPELVEVRIKDLTVYGTNYPMCVNKKVTVRPQSDFLKKVDKLDGAIKNKVRKFLAKFLEKRINPVVVCGNTAEEK